MVQTSAPGTSAEAGPAPAENDDLHFCEACENFRTFDYGEFVSHLRTLHKMEIEDYRHIFEDEEEDVEGGGGDPAPIEVIQIDDDDECEDWTDRCVYQCCLCMDAQPIQACFFGFIRGQIIQAKSNRSIPKNFVP